MYFIGVDLGTSAVKLLLGPALLELGGFQRGGAVQVHGHAAGAGAAGHPELPVQELEVQRLLQAVEVHHHRRDVVGGNGAQVHLCVTVVGPQEQRGRRTRSALPSPASYPSPSSHSTAL